MPRFRAFLRLIADPLDPFIALIESAGVTTEVLHYIDTSDGHGWRLRALVTDGEVQSCTFEADSTWQSMGRYESVDEFVDRYGVEVWEALRIDILEAHT